MKIIITSASLPTLAAAKHLRSLLPEADIVLVNRSPRFLHRRHTVHVINGEHGVQEHAIDLEKFAHNNSIRFMQASAKQIERENKILVVHADQEHRLHYDALLLDMPSDSIAEHHITHSLEGESSANSLREHIIEQLHQAKINNNQANKTFVIFAQGLNGVELATEIAHLTHKNASEHFIFPQELNHILVEKEEIQSNLRKRLLEILKQRRIEYSTPTNAYAEEGRVTIDGRLIPTNTSVYHMPTRGNKLFSESGLAQTESGHLLVLHDLRTSDDNIFAIGHSVGSIGNETMSQRRRAKELIREGQAAAINISQLLKGKSMQPHAPSKSSIGAVTLGPKDALGWIGPIVWRGKIPYNLHKGAEKKALLKVHNY